MNEKYIRHGHKIVLVLFESILFVTHANEYNVASHPSLMSPNAAAAMVK